MTGPGRTKRRSDLVTRGIIWGGVVVLGLLVAFDLRAKWAADGTAAAWRAAQELRYVDDREFLSSELEMLIRGNPTRQRRPATKHREVAREEETFTWTGIFRRYQVTVYLGLGEDQSVEFIEGPGQPANSSPPPSGEQPSIDPESPSTRDGRDRSGVPRERAAESH